MADGPALELQAALVAALRGSGAVYELVGGRIYDEPSDNAPLPYIRLGGIEPLPLRTTASLRATRIMFGVEAHSRPDSGRVEATRIAEAVTDLLDGATDLLTLGGYHLTALDWMTQTAGRDSDGKTYLAITAFQAMIEPTGS